MRQGSVTPHDVTSRIKCDSQRRQNGAERQHSSPRDFPLAHAANYCGAPSDDHLTELSVLPSTRWCQSPYLERVDLRLNDLLRLLPRATTPVHARL